MYRVIKNKDFKFKKRNKYGANKKEYNGRYYHSQLEAKVAQDLDWRLKAKDIKEVIPQFKISLDVNGKHIANYFVDFKVIHNDNSIEYIEVKGLELEVWRLKWLLFEALLPNLHPNEEVKLTVIK